MKAKLTGIEALIHSWRPRLYKGVRMVPTGISWTVWFDYVTERHFQPRYDTLVAAKAAITLAKV